MWWKSMKTKILFSALLIGFCLLGEAAIAQTAGDFFNRAARSYVKTAKEQALREVNDGLAKYPNDAKLKALKEKLEQEQQQQKDPSQKEDSKSDQKDGEKTNEDKAKEGQKGENPSQQSEEAGQNGNDQMDANLADRQKKMEAMREKLKGLNLSPEQAAQILESLNAAELRYIQDNKKKATQQPKRGLPDW